MAKKQPATETAPRKRGGLKPLMIWLTPEEHAGIRRAADTDGRSMANYCKQNTLEAVVRRLGSALHEQ